MEPWLYPPIRVIKIVNARKPLAGFSTETVETEGRSLESIECMQIDWWGRLRALHIVATAQLRERLHGMLYRHITGAIQWLQGQVSETTRALLQRKYIKSPEMTELG